MQPGGGVAPPPTSRWNKVRKILLLPFTDLGLTVKTQQPYDLDETLKHTLALVYGFAPTESKVLQLDDGGNLKISSGSRAVTAGAPARIPAAVANTQLVAANTARRALTIFNDSTALLNVRLDGGVASATAFHFQLAAAAFWESPPDWIVTGIVNGFWTVANGAANVAEYT
jgi:hypothetical protein